MTGQTRARLKLIGVFLIFAGPLLLAYLLYYGLSYGGASTNKGELVNPPVTLPSFSVIDRDGATHSSADLFDEKWTILQVVSGDCGEACLETLRETRQIRALLHRRVTRVQRIVLGDVDAAGFDISRQPDLSVYSGGAETLMPVLEDKGAGAPGMVYLIDPLGNWMLYYPPSDDGSALFDDLKHLLKLSNIG